MGSQEETAMSEFFNQYFDFTVMGDHFSEVLEGFLKNLLALRRRSGARADLGADPGAHPSAARQEIHARSAV